MSIELKQIQDRITELRNKIEYYSDLYYNKDNPVIEDSEYDKLFYELIDLEKKYPQFDSKNSPTHKVGGKSDNKFQKVTHEIPMGSLGDVFSYDELIQFINKLPNDLEFSVESKIDGLSVSLVYENGNLIQGSTRGDGLVGEDITSNVLTIKDIPSEIDYKGHLEVRGEVYMPRKVFAELNRVREENGEKTFANPRNAAAGSLRQLDSNITKQRKLSIFIFNIQKCDKKFDTHYEGLKFLESLGFTIVPLISIVKTNDDIIKYVEYIGEKRPTVPFDIDGAVIKVNGISQRDTIGFIGNNPKWAIAYKYPPERACTRLNDISIQIGRTGVLTPNAVFDTVSLAGTSVSRATLHNIDYIRDRDIRIGDYIYVQKAGDIIPEVIGVELSKRSVNSVEYKMPDVCPSCGEKVYQQEDEVAYRCTNPSCPAQLLRTIEHFASKDAMDIDGLGPAIVEQLINNNLVKSPEDIYLLTVEQLLNLDGFAQKSAENLVKSISESKERGLSRLLFALGIRLVGSKTAKDLAKRFGNIENLIDIDLESLTEIDDIGGITAKNISNFFSHETTKILVNNLKRLGVKIEEDITLNSVSLEGLTFVVTGTLPTMSRSQVEELIEKNGGKVSSSVSKKTSYVVVGSDAGSKLTKAEALGIKILSESDLINLIG